MKASVVDLRYKMKHILKALERNEPVSIMYHGKEKGIIIPAKSSTDLHVSQHPFFGLTKGGNTKPVEDTMDEIRSPRY
jgi:hypothetical protein